MAAFMARSESGALAAISAASARVVAVGDDARHEPGGERRLRVEQRAREQHLLRLHGSHRVEELLRQRKGHDEPDPRQRHAHPRARPGDAQIAVQRQLEAAGDRVALHHGDGWDGAMLELVQCPLDLRELDAAVGPARQPHFLQVESRAERLSGAGQDNRAEVGCRRDLADGGVQRLQHRHGHGVPLVGPVQSDGRDRAVTSAEQLVGSHG
jgi:hypothetical protein